MTKELKALGALNDIIEKLEDEHLDLSKSDWVVEKKQIIETALKASEQRHKMAKWADKKLKEKLKKQAKILRIIKTIPFELKYDEDTDDWHLYIIITTQDGEYRETVAFGEGKDKYDLLKEVLL